MSHDDLKVIGVFQIKARLKHFSVLAQPPLKVLDVAGNITDEEQIVAHEVDSISFSERSIELDTGAGGDDTLFVLFGLLAVRTPQHGEGAAARLCTCTEARRLLKQPDLNQNKLAQNSALFDHSPPR